MSTARRILAQLRHDPRTVAMMLLLPLRFSDSFDWSKLSAWAFVAACLAGCALTLYSYVEKRRAYARYSPETPLSVGGSQPG